MGTKFDKIEHKNQSQPVRIDLNKELLPKQKTIEIFVIDAQTFRKTKNENPPTLEIGVSWQLLSPASEDFHFLFFRTRGHQ